MNEKVLKRLQKFVMESCHHAKFLLHNLGEVSHGKLTASQWYTLFVFIILLVVCEQFVEDVGSLKIKSNHD
ncbi:hypothetical protein VP01_3167g4 [Puccinia sorghi]|uniref:Uncharacterized protein n=1 Tax=Puccinia sorghi TaxID=27349 RepID=A0A0L6UZK4_9BASI|nr:hypothetical protein VP01_3167g4 [Puccinia sorghi]